MLQGGARCERRAHRATQHALPYVPCCAADLRCSTGQGVLRRLRVSSARVLALNSPIKCVRAWVRCRELTQPNTAVSLRRTPSTSRPAHRAGTEVTVDMDANVLTDHSTGKTYPLQEIGEVGREHHCQGLRWPAAPGVPVWGGAEGAPLHVDCLQTAV